MKKLLITFLLILLTSCDYSPIYSTKDSKFKINEIKTTGNKKLNKIFIKRITKYKNNSSNLIYDLEVSSSKNVRSITKDERGKTKILEMIISFNINIKRNDKIIKSKNILNNFSYSNKTNKFELNRYEKEIQNKMIENIVEEFILTVKTL